MTPPIRVVRWVDANATHSEHDEKDWPKVADVQTVGFVVDETDDSISLAQEILLTDGETTYRCTTVIPRPSVLEDNPQ